ncbi:MAG: TetR/AcrR family transcriptional regulator [Myxococcota bacterium]|jgi:AcrR family transcriptional regulator|nr:TetR family transcriptional regulator [Deltaproteobacteria bacterium]MCP4239391.1 TetR/AcrR family transcriptional regulator [bacterium]MDP6075652.1 TetR/AcrR family transcriptional regulator [Myxococcota bacterium]MDP7075396.1 TetR/AcrR family transcriptional regulator [Myxococcota bacterium]MDP7299559.1 TetR/AcrR family transcriptional regulator [Myxococcota bacterium]
MGSTSPGRGRPRDPGAGRAIIGATLELLTEEGYDGVRVAQLARRAGVSKATLYRRWPSKAWLVVAALRSTPPLEPVDTGSLREDLEALLNQFLAIFDSTPVAGLLAALAIERCRDPSLARSLDSFVRERRRPLVEAMQRAVARGEIPPTADLDLAASLAGGPIVMRVLFGGATDPAAVRQLAELVGTALGEVRIERSAC